MFFELSRNRRAVDIEQVCCEDRRSLLSCSFLHENTSPQIHSYQAIDCSGGRRSTAVSFLAPSVHAADPAYLMPTGLGGGHTDDGIQPCDPNPAAPGSITRTFLTYGKDADGVAIPPKTLRITHNTAQTVYPIMRDPNSITISKTSPVGLYDPYDPTDQEYRGYIGLRGGWQILLWAEKGRKHSCDVPLVFWNGARIGIGTDGQYLTTTSPNPLRYDPNAFRSIAPAETSGDTIPNGVVMWYRAGIAQAPNDDTEDQLAEWTIRDHDYLVNPKITARTNNQIPDNQLVTLINYDVSNVDNLYLPWRWRRRCLGGPAIQPGPGRMPIATAGKPGSTPTCYGWTGAINSINFLQTRIQEFTKATKTHQTRCSAQYFGGKGWPYYNIPKPTNDPNPPIKIPIRRQRLCTEPAQRTRLPATRRPTGRPSNTCSRAAARSRSRPPSAGREAPPDPRPGTPKSCISTGPSEREKIAFLEQNYVVTVARRACPTAPNPPRTANGCPPHPRWHYRHGRG
jgi:hypothetical protein